MSGDALDPVTEAEAYVLIASPPPITRANVEAMAAAVEKWRTTT